jgi:hypothetical protein
MFLVSYSAPPLLFLLLYHIVAVVVAMTMIKSEVP